MVTHKEALQKALEACEAETECVETATEACIRTFCEAKGLVLVPKEPTDSMCDADPEIATSHVLSFYRAKYKAMLAAAPDPFGDAE